jgi:hypothetical protein
MNLEIGDEVKIIPLDITGYIVYIYADRCVVTISTDTFAYSDAFLFSELELVN